jgi:hypothetical protein
LRSECSIAEKRYESLPQLKMLRLIDDEPAGGHRAVNERQRREDTDESVAAKESHVAIMSGRTIAQSN